MNESEAVSTYQVVMPRLGLTMRDGKILEWLKKDGDLVSKGEPLFTIENEKASLEIESPASGVLKILVPVDVVVPILTPVGLLSGSGVKSGHHSSDEIKAAESKSKDVISQFQTAGQTIIESSSSPILATPRARKLAKKAGIDLHGKVGSGLRGMLVCADINSLIGKKSQVKATPLARRKAAEAGVNLADIKGSGPRGMVRQDDVARMVTSPTQISSDITAMPLSELRSIIASRLGHSWQERPQVTLTTEADATLFLRARHQINKELENRNIKVSINSLIVKLTAQALDDFPYMNVSLIAEGLYQHPQINIGLAVDTLPGLMVPVVHNANKKSYLEIAQELDGLLARTLKGKNASTDLTGGTFTITNLGPFEIDAFTPIINPPECGILGVGRILEKPVVVDGQISIRNRVALSLSFDHRLVDGAPAARFLQRIKQYIEQPFLWSLW